MIIDAILDRKHGLPFDAEEFESYVIGQAGVFGFEYFRPAFFGPDSEIKEDNVKRALVMYIVRNNYRLELIPYVLSVRWT